MTSDGNDDNFQSVVKGQLPGAELVIGLVGPVGANLRCLVQDLTKCLQKYEYHAEEIHISDLIKNLAEIPAHDVNSEFQRTNALMTAGDNARKNTANNAVLALATVYQIYSKRLVQNGKVQPQPRQAYIINSLKHPDEVEAFAK